MIDFFKYQGTGNDFILVNNLSGEFHFDKIEFVKKWCDRRFGIGSDGLIFLEKCNDTDFYVDFYNPDGSRSFCGNGSRCAVKFALKLGIINSSKTNFKAIDGIHFAEILDETINVKMKDVLSFEKNGSDYFMNTGSPHYISFEEKEKRDIIEFGKKIRYADQYKPNGTNVNLVEVIMRNHIQVKTYERGVEDETFSCGTGVTACALSYADKFGVNRGTVLADVKGGRLHVKFERHENGYRNIWLEGPAQFVYQGIIHD